MRVIIFRDDSEMVSATCIASQMRHAVDRIREGNAASVLDSLILAGRLESAAWDAEWPCSKECSTLTDKLARHLVSTAPTDASVEPLISTIVAQLPNSVRLSTPEGFSYYSLHPGDFADAAASMRSTESFALIGIRSIGTTLSAVALAQLQSRNALGSRITVRPLGHPFDRKTHFTGFQGDWIEKHKAQGSQFLVLDEGPGLSGSSFLSVAEGLSERGVSSDRITLIGTRECDPQELRLVNAAERWNRFTFRKVYSRLRDRFGAFIPLSGDAWRKYFLGCEKNWPASWQMMESLRFFSPDREHIFKFEGLGASGAESLGRAHTINKAGFGPRVEDAGEGIHRYDFVPGRPLMASDLSSEILDQLWSYCAFRAEEFESPTECGTELQNMVQFNFSQEFGREVALPDGVYGTQAAVIADCRMQPHEWIQSPNGRILKVDSAQHGNDHFLPGPTDFRWDLAGAIVEWDMSDDVTRTFCQRFRHHSGKSTTDLPYFELAYCIFRLSYLKMAWSTTTNPAERKRLARGCAFYRRKAQTAERTLLQNNKG